MPLPTQTPRVGMVVEQLWQPVPGGSGTYIRELAEALSLLGVPVVGIAARHRTEPPDDWTTSIPVAHSRLPRRALYDAWLRTPGPRAEAIAGPVEVVHATTWAVPATRLPLVVTVHDVAFLDRPDHFSRRGADFFRRALAATRDRAQAVIVPSEATAQAVVAAGLPEDRLVVVPHGVGRVVVTDDERDRFRRDHGLDRPYVFWCGTVEPRKNLGGLVEAFSRASVHRPDVLLALAGPQGWGTLPDLPPGLDPARVRLLGPLPRKDLHAAYAGATVFAFPSYAEGFGLPVLEAMHHAVPVVTSAGTACAEVAGDAGVLVDPKDPDDLAAGLLRALGPDGEALGAAGAARAATFSWQHAAEATLEVYRSVLR